MPAAALPPTPAPSTDIKGKESKNLYSIDANFALPPSAVGQSINGGTSLASPSTSGSQSRKASTNLPDYSLPPPPSRSRKIIQVKPKGSSEERDATYTPSSGRATKSTSKDAAAKRKSASGPSPGTAAGRKVARKTAHSIIERRRRSKMNEEFGVLKDLIPACRGCEMHKLAILQASIEYLRYLENCVAELKAGRAASSEAPSLPSSHQSAEAEQDPDAIPADDQTTVNSDNEEEEHDDVDGMDVDDENDNMRRPSSSTNSSHQSKSCLFSSQKQQHQPQHPRDSSSSTAVSSHLHRSSTASSAATSTLPSPYFGPVSSHTSQTSTTTSPVFGPYYSASNSQLHHSTSMRHGSSSHARPSSSSTATSHSYQHPGFTAYSRNSSTHTSPVIYPQVSQLHQGLNEAEASTALLMLNQDRSRTISATMGSGISIVGGTNAEKRGMSVRDLLSS